MKTIFMPKRLWKKWDKALRSGGYRQANGVLYDKESCGFCCLGVLQHVATGGEVEVHDDGTFRALIPRQWLRDNGIKFTDSMGNEDDSPYLPSLRINAIAANDRGMSFKVIADAIAECVQFTDETP